MHRRILQSVLGVLATVLAVASGAAQVQSSVTEATSVTVTTREGPVRGFTRDGVHTFLGIPYAAPPVGDLRWKAPAAPKAYDLLDATQFAKTCAQSNLLAVFTGPASIEEDCLYLNIFTTGVGEDNELKPVIVWIHGGGNFTGSSNDYDGSGLAAGGSDGTPTVVVTLNYRLGLLGFLAHPAFRQESELFANYGILDQQAALRWVQDNIKAFGGDPARVAVGGQSGGSVNTHANVISPLSAGLFNRAIFQSAPTAQFSALDAATARALAFAEAAGCAGTDAAAAACLRKLSVPRILQLQGTIKDNGPFIDPANQNVIVDGTVIPLPVAEAYASGNFNKMPVLGGATHDELTFVMGYQQYYSGPPPGSAETAYSSPPQKALTKDDYEGAVKQMFGPAAPLVLAEYPATDDDGSIFDAYNRVLADPLQCFANLQALKVLAASVPTYGYAFTYQDAPYFMPKMPGYRALAAHTIDIQFLFRNYHGGPLGVNLDQSTGMPRDLNDEEARLSDQLIGFWTNFANTGNPNKPGTSLWPELVVEEPVLLQQDIPLATLDEAIFRTMYNCAFWESLQQ